MFYQVENINKDKLKKKSQIEIELKIVISEIKNSGGSK